MDEKGSAFFALILALLFFGSMGLATVSLMATNLAGSTDNLQASQAFYVAEGGIHHQAMNEFFYDPDWSDNISPTSAPFGPTSISLGNGEYWVEYLNQTSDSVDLRVTGQVNNAVRVITQTLTSKFQYAALAGNNLNAANSTGTVSGDLGIEGNLNIDEDITFNGGVVQNSSLNLPSMDFQTYADMTTETHNGAKVFLQGGTYSGDLYVNGNVIFQDNVTFNGLLYVTGNVLDVGENVTINGSLIVEGNIAVTHDNLTIIAQQIDADSYMPAIVSMGDVNFANSDNLTIEGLVYSNGNIDLSSTIDMNIDGGLIADGNILFNYATNMSLSFNPQMMTGVPGMQNFDQTIKTATLSNWKYN